MDRAGRAVISGATPCFAETRPRNTINTGSESECTPAKTRPRLTAAPRNGARSRCRAGQAKHREFTTCLRAATSSLTLTRRRRVAEETGVSLIHLRCCFRLEGDSLYGELPGVPGS